MKENLTDSRVDSLRPSAKGAFFIWDKNRKAPAGFGVRVTQGGTIAFVLEYRNKLGVSRRLTVARWDELPKDAKKGKVERAREMATSLRAEINNGADPVQDEKDKVAEAKGEKTVKDLCEAYMTLHVMLLNGPDQRKNARRMIDKVIIPRWGERKLSTLKKADVVNLHNELGARRMCLACKAVYAAKLAACPRCKGAKWKDGGRYSANQLLTVVKAMFNHGVSWEWCATNPAEGIKRHPEDKLQKWLTDEQMAALDRAITEYGQDAGELIRLLLLTGARRGEWMRAKKADFDLEHAIWTKLAHSVKERRTESVNLNRPTLAVLERVIASTAKDEPYLFPGAKGARKTVRRPWIQILRMAGLAEEYSVAGKRGKALKRYRPTIRLHDLRHTYASWLAQHGVPLKTIGKLLGHQQGSTTDRYTHIADRAAADATNLYGDAMSKMVQ